MERERRKFLEGYVKSCTDKELESVVRIIAEFERAKGAHPKWPADEIHQAAIVSEEAGELVKSSLQYRYEGRHKSECRKEAIQTGAMALRFLVGE